MVEVPGPEGSSGVMRCTTGGALVPAPRRCVRRWSHAPRRSAQRGLGQPLREDFLPAFVLCLKMRDTGGDRD